MTKLFDDGSVRCRLAQEFRTGVLITDRCSGAVFDRKCS
jgi:hypothetical protein